MVFPSLAYRTDRAETVAWYTAVAAEGLPVMIYNNPLAYRVDVDIPTLEGLAGIPGIVAIKEETGDIRRVTDLFNAFGDRFAIFCGVDDLILESLALGAVGWVSGMTNAWPAECVRLFDLARARDPAALALYRLMTPAFHLDTDVKLVQYIKLAEHLVMAPPPGSGRRACRFAAPRRRGSRRSSARPSPISPRWRRAPLRSASRTRSPSAVASRCTAQEGS